MIIGPTGEPIVVYLKQEVETNFSTSYPSINNDFKTSSPSSPLPVLTDSMAMVEPITTPSATSASPTPPLKLLTPRPAHQMGYLFGKVEKVLYKSPQELGKNHHSGGANAVTYSSKASGGSKSHKYPPNSRPSNYLNYGSKAGKATKLSMVDYNKLAGMRSEGYILEEHLASQLGTLSWNAVTKYYSGMIISAFTVMWFLFQPQL